MGEETRRCGYLHSFNKLVNQWNRRFFTLKGDKLAITVSETSTKIINEYPIADATVTEPAPGHNREMVISITTKANKTVIISSHNHTSLNIWYHVLMDSSHTDRTEEDHELYENPTATRASSGSPLSPASHTRRDSFSVNTSMFRVPHDSPEAQQYQQQQYAGSGGPSTPVSGLSLQPGAPIITHGAHTVVSPSAGPHTISASQLLLQAPVDVHYYKRAMEQTGGLPIDFTMNVTFSTNGRTFKPYYMCLSSRARVMMLFYQERDVTLYSSSNKSTWAYSFELHGGSLYKCDYLEHPHPCYELSLPMSTGFLSVEDAEDMETLASTMCRTTLLSLRTPDKALVIQGHKYHPTALGKHGFLWKKTGTKAWKRFFYRTEVNARGTVCLVEYTGISARATECTFLLWTSGEASCKFLRGLPHGDPWAAMEENRALETHCVTVVTASERMVLRADSEAELESWMATLISISADDFLTGPVEAPDSNHYDTLVIPPSATLQDVTNSYHILAKQYHPDRNDSADAEAAFDRIRAAYECLSNTPARLRYDQVFALMESRREVADEYRKHEKEQLLVPFESRDVLIFPERPGKRNHVPESSVFRPALPSELYITVEALHAWTTARVQIAKRRGDKPNLNMPSIANIRVSAARPDRGASTMRPLLMHSASLGPGAPSPHSHQASPVGFPASASASGASQPTTPTQHAIALSRAASLRSPASHAPATSSSSTYSPTSPQDSATASHNADLESIATTGYNSAEQQQQQQHSREQAREAKEHAKEQARKERHARRAQEELARIEAEEAKARAEAEAAAEAQRVAEEEERERIRKEEEAERARAAAAAEELRLQSLEVVERPLDASVQSMLRVLGSDGVEVIKVPESRFANCTDATLWLCKRVVAHPDGRMAAVFALVYRGSDGEDRVFGLTPATSVEARTITSRVDKAHASLAQLGLVYTPAGKRDPMSVLAKKALTVLFHSDADRQRVLSMSRAVLKSMEAQGHAGDVDDVFFTKYKPVNM